MANKLRCKKCPKVSESIKANPKAWNGWQIAPVEICPDCIESDLKAKGFEIRLATEAGKKFIYLHYQGSGA